MLSNYSKLIKEQTKADPSECRICGEGALYSHYGARSCQPCKMFFKRNVQNKELLKCDFNGECDINLNTRHICASCRLSKCFKQGMKTDTIRRSSTVKKDKQLPNDLIKYNSIQQISIINLLKKDQSLLDKNQCTLLSNLINSYDESKVLSINQNLIDQCQYSTITTIDENLVRKSMMSFYEEAGACLRMNNDINQLSSDNDRSILIHTGADNVTCLGGIFIMYYSKLFEHQVLWNYLENLYGKQPMNCQRWATKFTEPDVYLFKLTISLFLFSTNSRIFHKDLLVEYENLNEILSIQNKYAELTWKYLIDKYGYHQAIHKFMNIIRWLLASSLFMHYAHNAQTHVNDIQSLIEQTEVTLLLDDVDRITQNDG